MLKMNELFFELIQVSLGTRICLSHTPNADEWGELYSIAKKQSLVGVCFAGVQRLQSQKQAPPEMLYLTWMGMAAKIQQRNEVVNRQCVDLQAKLSAEGLRSSILKGQGVASLYSAHLRGLRQSGDIDVYVDCGMEKAMEYARGKFSEVEYDYINAHLLIYTDTEVELHWRIGYMVNLFKNRKLQGWVKSHEDSVFGGKACFDAGEITVPTAEFNAFYILLHAFNHVNSEGLGLRQLMDYYFVLRDAQTKGFSGSKVQEFQALLKEFGMMKFARGVMWLLHEVFGMERECMICEPDEKEGRFLLNEVMTGGNFGHHDERMKKIGTGKMVSVMNEVQHSMSIASHYPSAVFWRPIWIVYHFVWKRLKRI